MKSKNSSMVLISTCLVLLTENIEAVIFTNSPNNLQASYKQFPKSLVPKVSLTQKGYIQFLRYVVDVPTLTDYTFCIWVRSNNLTYNHPLLSYSKHEEDRLIRVWISPLGTYLNLEILQVPVFSVPVHFVENEWYHVCQSWSSYHAAWNFYLNGKLKANGNAAKLKKTSIDPGGDIVIGQEYTDFDKGLEDGIEGDISGFNFVLASTVKDPKLSYLNNNHFKRESGDSRFTFPKDMQSSKGHGYNEQLEFSSSNPVSLKYPLEKHVLDETRQVLTLYDNAKTLPLLPLKKIKYGHHTRTQSFSDYLHEPLGLLLVELSFDCGYLKGAPLSGKRVLVSWTKTQVRVFGGAILKTVPPFCVK